jgi:ribosomal protein S18 acetylase RimI-like enzyme
MYSSNYIGFHLWNIPHYIGILDNLKAKEKCRKYIIERQQDLLKDPDHFFFVADDTKKVIGMITGHVGDRDESRVYRIERIGFIDEVCVHPDYRTSDIGNELLETMLDRLYAEDI